MTLPDSYIPRTLSWTDDSLKEHSFPIGLLVVGRLDYGDLVKMLYPVQEQLGREINRKLYAPEEWKAARKQNSAFVQDILGKPVIELIGNKDDPGKSGRLNIVGHFSGTGLSGSIRP